MGGVPSAPEFSPQSEAMGGSTRAPARGRGVFESRQINTRSLAPPYLQVLPDLQGLFPRRPSGGTSKTSRDL